MLLRGSNDSNGLCAINLVIKKKRTFKVKIIVLEHFFSTVIYLRLCLVLKSSKKYTKKKKENRKKNLFLFY